MGSLSAHNAPIRHYETYHRKSCRLSLQRRRVSPILRVQTEADLSTRTIQEIDSIQFSSDEDSGYITPATSTSYQVLDPADYGEHGAAFLSGNYYPVGQEVTACCGYDAQASDDSSTMKINGKIPSDFPLGQYAYIGPNPKFAVDHYKRWGSGPGQVDFGLGSGWHHWFEGDGMIYAVDFCTGNKVKFRNRFIRTSSWKREIKSGKRIFRPLMNADGGTFLANALSNLIMGGMFMKDSANTALLHFAGRTFALQDTCPPWELDPETLETISACTFDGKLPPYVPFTAHPKVVPSTGELIFFGFNPVSPPHCSVGTLKPDGTISSINSLWSIPFVGSIFMHDFCVTEHFTILFEGSMDIKPVRQLLGKHPLQYNEDKRARFGVLNRDTQSTSVTWFNCSSSQMVYHFINSWEEKNEKNEQLIVITGIREDGFFQEAMRSNGSSEWIKDAVRVNKIPKVHEWRINLVTGKVTERYLFSTPLETPRINDAFVGRRNRYAYAGRILLSELESTTQLKFDAVVKIDMQEQKTVTYEHGPNRYGMEAQFVGRPGGVDEDDGWLVMYVHDESYTATDVNGRTECVIIDAQDIEAGPIATILLPERVPYGAHCMWRADLKYPGKTFEDTAVECEALSANFQVNEPKMFAFKQSQRGELLEAVWKGLSRLALGLFVHGWSPRIARENITEYAFVRGAGLRFLEVSKLGSHRMREAVKERSDASPAPPSLTLYDVEDDDSCRLVREVLSICDVSYLCKPCPTASCSNSSELAILQGVERGSGVVPFLRDNRSDDIAVNGADAIVQYLYQEYLDGEEPASLVSLLQRFAQASKIHDVSHLRISRVCEQPLIFWGYEASPFCALVRKALNERAISYVFHPCARGSPRRSLLLNRTGIFQVPYLEDPNTGISLFESVDIISYLKKTYD